MNSLRTNFLHMKVYNGKVPTLSREILKLSSKKIHFQKPTSAEPAGTPYEQFGAHSPLWLGRGKIEEHKSRLFFEAPPVPYRMSKFILLYVLIAGFFVGFREKKLKIQRQYLSDKEKELNAKIVPFIQAMENLRFTAVEQRAYMIEKAVADQYSPGLYELIRKRFYQDDIFIQNFAEKWQFEGQSSAFNNTSGVPEYQLGKRSITDVGLFDGREVGYTD